MNELVWSWVGPKSRRHRPDLTILVTAASLLIIGIVLQFLIGPAISVESTNYFFIRHIFSVFLGIGAFVVALYVPIKYWVNYSFYIIILGLALSILGIITGGLYNRWLQVGFFSFQPVELLKLGFVLYAAVYLAEARRSEMFTKSWQASKTLLIVAAVIALVVVILQRDLGSAAVIGAVLTVMLWVSGFSLRLFLGFAVILALLGGVFIASTPYRRDRFETFLNPTSDCQGNGYHICQALIGVGSGGLFGRGVGKSVQSYGYLPESSNDSIFVVYAEIFGYVGVLVLLAIFLKLFHSIYRLSSRLDDTSMLVSIGLLSWLAVQTFMNIGAMIGLIPLKGITLPFISYGGSSILMVMLAMGILLRLSSYTIYGNEREETNTGVTYGRRVRRSRDSDSSTRSKVVRKS